VTGRFNFLLTDGHVIAGTTAGHTLFYRQGQAGGADSVTVASEPADDDPAWTEIPDRSLIIATASDVKVRSLPVPPEVTADSAERVQHGSFPQRMAGTSSPEGRNPSQ
jgi:glutamine amidotransferase